MGSESGRSKGRPFVFCAEASMKGIQGGSSARARKARRAAAFEGLGSSLWRDAEPELSGHAARRANGGLAAAVAAQPFKASRVARAIAKGGRFEWLGDGSKLMPLKLSFEALKKGESSWVEAPRRARDRGPKRLGCEELWEMAWRWGGDFDATDQEGRGFERWALSMARSGRPSGEAGLRLWRRMGRGPDRAGAGVGNLIEAMIAEGALDCWELLSELWPEACSKERLVEALRRSDQIVKARWGAVARPRKLALRLAASWILERAPEALSPDRSLSQALDRWGAADLARKVEMRESALIAEAERGELIAAVGESGGKRSGRSL